MSCINLFIFYSILFFYFILLIKNMIWAVPSIIWSLYHCIYHCVNMDFFGLWDHKPVLENNFWYAFIVNIKCHMHFASIIRCISKLNRIFIEQNVGWDFTVSSRLIRFAKSGHFIFTKIKKTSRAIQLLTWDDRYIQLPFFKVCFSSFSSNPHPL